MADEKMLTLHPLGKTGKSITVKRYEQIKDAIVSALGRRQLTHTELMEQINFDLRGKFDANTHWYGETVKLDLEARDVIERTGSKPPKYRLKG